MADYKHGVFTYEQPTSVLPPRRITAALPVFFGTAPVARLDPATAKPVNEPVLCSNYAEFVAAFGWDDDWSRYTLCEAAHAFFALYAVGPAVFVNVLDPGLAAHQTAIADAQHAFGADGRIALAHHGLTGLEIKSADGLTTYQTGTDYAADGPNGVITRVADGTIPAGATVRLSYTFVDPSKVVTADIIGGIDAGTGKKAGLETLGEVFPRFRLVPGLVAAPGWSQDPSLAIVMAAKCAVINSHFRARAVVDLPESVARYADAPGYKNDHNLTDERMIVCWPRCTLAGKAYWLSSLLTGCIARTDADHEDVPYKSPSNERLYAEGAVLNGGEVWLGPDEAGYLNGQGIVTALNFTGGWKVWGNRTGCYPDVTDVKDAFIPIARMFDWIANTLVLTAWQWVDAPVTRRLVDTVTDSFNIWLNGLAAREFILGGRVEFLQAENPDTDLMDGIVRWHVSVTPPSPAREMDFIVEYDTSYLATLFA